MTKIKSAAEAAALIPSGAVVAVNTSSCAGGVLKGTQRMTGSLKRVTFTFSQAGSWPPLRRPLPVRFDSISSTSAPFGCGTASGGSD